ncbi:MAG TPA: cation:proton antiporter [Alphaproteobacteria bacterium]|nr:cation:proton antiporter [Alphaproteobacteria bacterium]
MTSYEMPLVTTLAFGLTMAFICGLIATKLRMSPLIGYLFAGILIGPHTPGFVADQKIADELSEVGIVLLMFGVGLHFSIKDLLEVRKIAISGALAQMAVSIAIGAAAATLWGWTLGAGLIFGLTCSVASTVVMTRALEDHHLLDTITGKISIGWLIVQDLVMVLALVLVPVLATIEMQSETEDWPLWSAASALGLASLKIVLFIAFMLVIGKKVFPLLLGLAASSRSRELFTLAVIAVAVGVAFAAGKIFGVSLALGAFFSGMMIKESDLSREVADRALPFQDAFAVLFFVSVGMLFDPAIIISHPFIVAFCVLMIVVAKSVAAFLIVIWFKYSMKTGMLVSAGMAQIGEFSFILATLGLSYGLLPPEGRDVILAAAILSILFNPMAFVISYAVDELSKKHPSWFAWANKGRKDGLASLKKSEVHKLKRTVILVGAGRVGSYICDHIDGNGNDLVVIDSNREMVEKLRKQGIHAIAGDAGSPQTLESAAIEKAVAIIIAIPDVFETMEIINAAKAANPAIHVIIQDRYDVGVIEAIEDRIDLKVSASDEIGRRMLTYLEKLE